jgi:ketosteroid isomerase-like protein
VRVITTGNEKFIAEVLALDAELDAALDARDFETIERLYAPEFMLNSPVDKLQSRQETIDLLRRISARQTEKSRAIEVAYASGDVVVIMGSESLVWQDTGTGLDGEPTTRRFTNVWRQIDGSWKRIARHANNVTPN